VKSKVDPSKIEINIPMPDYEQEQLDHDSVERDFGAPKAGDQNKPGQPESRGLRPGRRQRPREAVQGEVTALAKS